MKRNDNRAGTPECVIHGLKYATLFSAWVLFWYFVTGGKNLERFGFSLGEIIAAYYAGGISIGVVVGLVNPYLGSRLAAMGFGVVLMVPVSVALLLTIVPLRLSLREAVAGVLLNALVLGPLYAFVLYQPDDT